jgi:hypothetical protein
MKFTRFLSAILALAFMSACGGISPTGVDDDDCDEREEECEGGMVGSDG